MRAAAGQRVAAWVLVALAALAGCDRGVAPVAAPTSPLARALAEDGDRLWIMARVARMDVSCDPEGEAYEPLRCQDSEYRLIEMLRANGFPQIALPDLHSAGFWAWLRGKREAIASCQQASSPTRAAEPNPNVCDPYEDVVRHQGRGIESVVTVPESAERGTFKSVPIDQLMQEALKELERQGKR